jgi:hypothetical protein
MEFWAPSPSISLNRDDSSSDSQQRLHSQQSPRARVVGVASDALSPQSAPLDDDGRRMVFQTLLVLVALQVLPSYFVELVHRVELSGLPILIALGVVPSLFLKMMQGGKSNHGEFCVSSPYLASSSLQYNGSHEKESAASLVEIERYYCQRARFDHRSVHAGDSDWTGDNEENRDRHEVRAMLPAHLGARLISASNRHGEDDNDWGQFAYYGEEPAFESDLSTKMMRSCSLSSSARG